MTNPKLWWPHNLGEPRLTEFDVLLYSFSGPKMTEKYVHSIKVKMGIRSAKLVREKDTLGDGQLSFKFNINGVNTFAKGANYVPTNFFLPSGLRAPSTYDALLANAVAGNFNMLRVWGGGYYELNYFYELCDTLGIMIWQDFMFANSMYPGTSGFIDNVKQEATYQIQRLRNHPSVVFWCGNNEIL